MHRLHWPYRGQARSHTPSSRQGRQAVAVPAGRYGPVGAGLPAMQTPPSQSLTLAKVDSLRAWLSAAIGPLCGDSTIAWGIGIIATC